MPSRVLRPLPSWLQHTCHSVQRTVTGPSTTSSPSFRQVCQASTAAQTRKQRDPYAIAQAKARKAANLSRQEVLRQERADALGSPIRGNSTPLLESFDTAQPTRASTSRTSNTGIEGDAAPEPTDSTQSLEQESLSRYPINPKHDTDRHLNFFLTKAELNDGFRRSAILSNNGEQRPSDAFTQSATSKELAAEELEAKQTAEEALRRISSLSLGTSKDRLRTNKQRCIDIFGRHNTDQHLPSKPKNAIEVLNLDGNGQQRGLARLGPDTGSSEVQIAILTAKIKSLADFLETRGKKDKVNKRNLRLLVHRRAKLLKYLQRKEHGGPRWQHLVDSLGLTDGTWKGEITL